MPNSRSPLKARPLRNPGQSLDEQIHELIETNIGGSVFLAVFTILLAALEWWHITILEFPRPVYIPLRQS